jgi:hypothetical protein
MNTLTKQDWKERAMLLGRIMEALSNVTDLPILRETLTHAEEQRGRAIGHAMKARKAQAQPARAETEGDGDLGGWN